MAPKTPKSRNRLYEDRDKSRKHRRKHVSRQSQSGIPLSAEALAKLDKLNRKSTRRIPEVKIKKTRNHERIRNTDEKKDPNLDNPYSKRKRRRRRVVSGALLEEGREPKLREYRSGKRDQGDSISRGRRNKSRWIWIGIALIIFTIIMMTLAFSKKKKKNSSIAAKVLPGDSEEPSNSNLHSISESSIPEAAKGTYLDPFSWYDTTDFNVTYTNETVGGLPIMGYNLSWDDSKSATPHTPPISKPWGSYSERPARGVNLGGWLSLEPFITPSLFNNAGIVDEYTLVSHLGNSAKRTLEKHYASFVNEQTFADIANAGLDHVRIPFSYWAVAIYDNDPYVFRVSWRYLLRGIEWARKYGLRINLDLHSLPGSQNGWNHSGRLGPIGWLNGTHGSLNAQRSLEIHNQLSQFFAQDRYKNIISFYGLVNEPKMTAHDVKTVEDWTDEAFTLVRKNGIKAHIVFGDGFMGLPNWKGKLQGHDGLVLDVHQYVIFNKDLIVFNHTKKIEYACQDWSKQAEESMDLSTGFGPTIFAEWSQADTDCAPNLNNVGWGTRWTGTYNSGDPSTTVLKPGCPLKNSQCDCSRANADPRTYSNAYKQFLQTFAEAQMASFEKGWGWFYWTWETEAATQWSYRLGLQAGILPEKAYAPQFTCSKAIPSFDQLPEYM
ncbi:BgTH12-03403 [Blumeria graminis f. sp. triticale]|uniref:glucan 1,3-beta-glucosidase n=1 Tax=Blumeria graminis f. sp. triticale TaxID=1689686 RepID=A0A9W4GCE7_BLUGR|nr:BgTH12-03403 [Blumeria graminis f. sp. triticale]